MRSLLLEAFAASLLLAASVKAQTPAFKGELLIQTVLNNGKCLTASSNTNGAAVTLQGCTGAAAQKWTFTGTTVTVFGNKCLDVTGGQNSDGTKLQIWTCSTNNANQQWQYSVWDNTLKWTNQNKCMDVTDGVQSDGNRIQIWTCSYKNPDQFWNTGYMVNNLPAQSQNDQYGTNNCGIGSSQTSKCQTVWINAVDDFCLWAPPTPGNIGDTEQIEVAWCTKSGRGTRTIPNGALKGVHFVKTPDYVQVTGVGDFTKINVPKGDSGGELDNRGADGRGNPIGGLVYGNSFGAGQQYHEWTSFISDGEFCFRACVGPKATSLCNHIYDVMGCYWNMPANYDAGTFENCVGDDAQPMGVYGTSTWYQGTNPTPPPHPAPSSSNCKPLPTVVVSPALRRRENGFERRYEEPAFPGATPAP